VTTPQRILSFTGPYQFLSNFYPCWVQYRGIRYKTAEHAFQSAKTYSDATKKRIAALATPYQAKRFGRMLELRPDWDSIRIQIMTDVLDAKFRQNIELLRQLLDTGETELTESDAWGDKFWGICDGVGENWLGRLLMQVRDKLRAVMQPGFVFTYPTWDANSETQEEYRQKLTDQFERELEEEVRRVKSTMAHEGENG
jgi:ribA/ribD-fused uncharacterized protein